MSNIVHSILSTYILISFFNKFSCNEQLKVHQMLKVSQYLLRMHISLTDSSIVWLIFCTFLENIFLFNFPFSIIFSSTLIYSSKLKTKVRFKEDISLSVSSISGSETVSIYQQFLEDIGKIPEAESDNGFFQNIAASFCCFQYVHHLCFFLNF